MENFNYHPRNKMYNYDDINGIHLEFTSRCNLKCPQCARIDTNGNVLPGLPIEDMPLTTVQKIFDEMGSLVDYAHICGNYGDIVAYPHTIEALDIIHNSGVKFIKVYSNASARDVDYWHALGQRLHSNHGQMVFSIDGLEDTNHLYRVGSNWKKIMENAQAFIDAGGNAIWEWLPFEHNDHQHDKAIKLAREMGFNAIILKKNPRFAPVNNGEHHLIKHSKVLFHTCMEKYQQANEDGKAATKYPISCKYKRRKMIFIDFEGLVLPCCWHGNRYKGKDKYNDFHNIIQNYGTDDFDVTKHTIEEILENKWYIMDMKYTMKILPTCRKHCELFSKMSNKDNRIIHEFKEYIDPEPWEGEDEWDLPYFDSPEPWEVQE